MAFMDCICKLRFFDDVDREVLLNSCVPSNTELTAVTGASADVAAPFDAWSNATVGDDSGAGNVGRAAQVPRLVGRSER